MDVCLMRKSLFYSLFVVSLLIAGCSVGTQESLTDMANQISSQEGNSEPFSADITLILQEAEAHYATGCEHYKHRRWELARQEFDNALETLLEADVDAEAHYMMGQTYDLLFYKIHTLEIEQASLRGMPEEERVEVAESTEQLEASFSYMHPELLEEETQESEMLGLFMHNEETLGEIVLDESDAEMMKYVKEFSRERSQYRKGFERANQYLPMMLEAFNAENIPTELILIPLIESNYRVDAVSSAGAVGLWQFVSATARCYGLNINKWVDERRDPEKSTKAAAAYLKNLYDMLGSWELAMAGYYMGEYKVHKAIGKYRTRNISELAKTRSFGSGAKRYVSRIKAAMYLAQHRDEYGLSLSLRSPIQYDRVQVKKGFSLKTFAREIGASYKDLLRYNPELRQGKTPPGKGTYTLKVPQGFGSVVVAQATAQAEDAGVSKSQPQTRPSQASLVKNDGLTYTVRHGDNLSRIAKRYNVDVDLLKELNGIRNVRTLQIGQTLTLPSAAGVSAKSQGLDVITYTIQKGETLATIAKRYHIKTATLKSYNQIKNERKLQIGQTLQVPLSSSSVLAKIQTENKMFTYRVKRGDSLSRIASTFGVSVNELQQWNNFGRNTLIYPGSRLKVWY